MKNYRIKPKIDDIFMTRIGTIGKCAIVTKIIPWLIMSHLHF